MKTESLKSVGLDLDRLPVMESFSTLQGEGYHTGRPAYFIRLAGCDVGCQWCDVKESWEVTHEQNQSIRKIVEELKDIPAEIVVITGGEPTLHDLDVLTDAIKMEGKSTHIETAGTNPLTGTWDWICFSPKKFRRPLDLYYDRADELKVVVYHPSDLKWASEHARRMNPSARLYLQPEWGRRHQMIPMIVEYVKENPGWRISLQTHKYLEIP